MLCLGSLQNISALLLVHLDDVVGNIVDVICSISILFLVQWSNGVHEMLRLHWSDVGALVNWIGFHAFLWGLEVVILRLTSDVE